MDTPPHIRQQYASPPHESPEQRCRRLSNRRAAKYRHFKSLRPSDAQREQNAQRQRRRRAQLDEDARERVRAQNRLRQQLRRQSLSESERQHERERQRERQRRRRQSLDEQSRLQLREKERLRVRRRRRKDERLPFGDGGQVTLPPPELSRFPLPHLQQVTPLFPMPSSARHTTPVPSVSLALPMQPRTIVLPPAHRSLPPLPDFLSSREAFNPANAAADTRPRRSSRALFPSADMQHETQEDAFFQR